MHLGITTLIASDSLRNMADIQKPSDESHRPSDDKAGKSEALNPERGVSGADVQKAESNRTNKFTTFGNMTTIKDGASLEESRAAQSAIQNNPFTIDMGDEGEVTSRGRQENRLEVLAGNPIEDAAKFAKTNVERLAHPDAEHPDTRMDYIADFESFKLSGLAKFGIDPLIISATIRNEIAFRKPTDNLQEELVKHNREFGGIIDSDHHWSVGTIQMQRRHIERLANAVNAHGDQLYPQLKDWKGIDFAHFVPSRQSGSLFVGAYFQDVAARLERGNEPVPWYPGAHTKEVQSRISSLWRQGTPESRTEALIRSYNPGDGTKHVEHVLEQMKQIRDGPGKLFE